MARFTDEPTEISGRKACGRVDDNNVVHVGERWTIALTGRTVVSPDVVGRDFDLAWLGGAWDAASAGNGGQRRRLLLGGGGRHRESRLAQVLATEALDRGLLVLRGRAIQVATPAAYPPSIPIAMAVGRLTTSVFLRPTAALRAALTRSAPATARCRWQATRVGRRSVPSRRGEEGFRS